MCCFRVLKFESDVAEVAMLLEPIKREPAIRVVGLAADYLRDIPAALVELAAGHIFILDF